MSSSSSSPATPIPLAAFVEHREMGARISASLAPLYTYSHIVTTQDELADTVSAVAALEPAQRPVAWVVGGAKTDEDVAALKKLLGENGLGGMQVLRVPAGTLERIGGPNMQYYALGFLDGQFRQ